MNQRKGVLLPYLKAWRTTAHLTQRDLAQLANISQSSIALLEEQNQAARKNTIEKLATALGITIHQLVNEPPTSKENIMIPATISSSSDNFDNNITIDSQADEVDTQKATLPIIFNYKLPNGVERHIPFPSHTQKRWDDSQIVETVILNLFDHVPRRPDLQDVNISIGDAVNPLKWPLEGINMDDSNHGVLLRPSFILDSNGYVSVSLLETEEIRRNYELTIKTNAPTRYFTFRIAYLVTKLENAEIVRFPLERLEKTQLEILEATEGIEYCLFVKRNEPAILSHGGRVYDLSWPPPDISKLRVQINFTDDGNINGVEWSN